MSRDMDLLRSLEGGMPLGLPVTTNHEIRQEVDTFLSSLALGTTRRDADLEDAIADKLHGMYHDCATLQHKLNQWVVVAMGLQEVIEQQHEKSRQLLAGQVGMQQPGLGLGLGNEQPGQQPGGSAVDMAMAAQHREVAALRDQMAMLRHEMTAMRQGGTGVTALQPLQQVLPAYGDVERLRAESASLRRALQDAELEIQHMSVAHQKQVQEMLKREQSERAHAAAEVLAAKHKAAAWQAKLQQQATDMAAYAQHSAPGQAGHAASAKDSMVTSVRQKQQELLKEVAKMQESMASMEHSAALQCAQQQAQEALQQEIDAMQADHAQALRAADTEREALAKEVFSAQEAATVQQDALMKQITGLTEQLQSESQLRASLEAQLANTSAQQQAHLQEQLKSQEATLAAQVEEVAVQVQSEVTALQDQLQDREGALKSMADDLAASESARKGAQVQLAEQERQSMRLELCITQLQEQVAAQEATSAAQHTAQLQQLQSHVEQLQGLLQQRESDLAKQLQDKIAAEDAHIAALEEAKREAEELRAQLAGAEESKVADMAECIDSHASHSEMLEQLQQEHEQEINRICAAAEADREHMQSVNGMLRAELADALSRMDAAESPPFRQRPSIAPQESPAAKSAQGRAASGSEQSPARDSERSSPCTLSPAQSGAPSLSTHGRSAQKPSSTAQCQELTTAEGCDTHQAAQKRDRQLTPSVNHASSQAKHVAFDLAAVLLISMTALQLRMERQLKPASPSKGSESQEEAADDGEQQAQQEQPEEAAVSKLQNEHVQQLRVLEERLQQEHALTCQHMREAQMQELQALQESLSAEHTSAAASLARQHSQCLASECERITSRLTEDHVRSLEDLREPLHQEHAAAMHALRQQHAHELAESRAAIQAELSKQHAAAESALRESLEQAHAASVQQQLADQAEKLSKAHEQAMADLTREKAAAVRALQEHVQALANLAQDGEAAVKAVQEQLAEEHAQALANLAEDREAAVKAVREQLSEEHAATCQHMQEAHAQELQAREQQLREEHAQVYEKMHAQHAQQVQLMAAEHAQGMEQLKLSMEQEFSEERGRLEVEHECQLALVQELAAEHARAQCQEQAQTLQKRCSELEEQLQADKSELGALQKQAAEHLASQTATPRKEHAELVRLRQECGQLRAQRADQAAQAQGLAAQLANERADSAALRQENLELATELNEASMDRHATEDAQHILRERCSELQESINMMSQRGSAQGTPRREPAVATLPAQHPLSRQLDAEGPAGHDVKTPDSAIERPESASASGSATPSARSGISEGSAIEQGSFSHEGEDNDSLDELQAQACQDGDAVSKAWQDEAAPWQAGADCTVQNTPMQTAKFSTPDPVIEPAASCLVVRALDFPEGPGSGAEASDERCSNCQMLEAKIQEQQAQYEDNLQRLNADIRADARALRISNQDLALTLRSTGAAEQLEDIEAERDQLAALADDTVAELEAMRAENIHLSSEAVMHDGELQARKQALAKLTTALEERDAEVAALQEQLEQLRALEQARGMPSPSTSDTPRVIAAQLQIEQLQRQLRSALQASQTASLPPTPVLLDTSSKVEGLARKHAAEVASLREAFHARLAALEEELQARNEQVLELEHALMSAEDALEQRQAALVECQDMLAEMQGFSEAQRHRADQEQAQAQAAEGMALEARAAAEVAAMQLHGAQREVQSSRRRTHDAELSAAAKSEALEEATLQMHHLQLELGEAKGQLRAAKAASAAAYERVEVLAAQLASVEGVSPLGLILRPSREQRWSTTEPVTKSQGSHGRRHRSSPGELAPAQHAVSADLSRPASLSLADIGMTGLAQPGSGRSRKAESTRQPRQARRQSEAGQQSRLRPGSESPVKRRRWTLAGEVMGLSTHELEGAHEVLSDQENSCAPSPACSSPLPRSCGGHVGKAGQESPEPLGSVHFSALYGELRTSDSPVRKVSIARSSRNESPSRLGLQPEKTAERSAADESRRSTLKEAEALVSLSCMDSIRALQQEEHCDVSPESRSRELPPSAQEDDAMLSPDNRPMLSSKVAAQRAIFSDPVPRKPGMPARDIAGRWHGGPPAYWTTCSTP